MKKIGFDIGIGDDPPPEEVNPSEVDQGRHVVSVSVVTIRQRMTDMERPTIYVSCASMCLPIVDKAATIEKLKHLGFKEDMSEIMSDGAVWGTVVTVRQWGPMEQDGMIPVDIESLYMPRIDLATIVRELKARGFAAA